MSFSINKLIKFFKLEASRNYDNRAVVGGLDKILPNWIREAEKENIDSEIKDLVVEKVNQYESSDHASRQVIISSLLRKLESVDPQQSKHGQQKQRSHQQERQPRQQQSKPYQKSYESERAIQYPSTPQPETPDSEKATITGLNAPLTVLNGIGPKIAESLGKLGIESLRDLLYNYPRRYDDYSQLKTINRLEFEDEVTILGLVRSISSRKTKSRRMEITEAVITDETGFLRLIWFNQPFIQKNLRPGTQIVVSGKIDEYLGRLVIKNPEWEKLDSERLHTNRIVPVYPLTAGVHQRWLRRQMHKTVSFWAPRIVDYLPESVKSKEHLYNLADAITQIHFPENKHTLSAARKRLAFDEIFFLQLGVLRQKHEWCSVEAREYLVSDRWQLMIANSLPFKLTSAQQRAISTIRADLRSYKPMNRLLQGDVGSGKTIVAGFAAAIVLSNRAQAAVMAPTSILAEQHFENFKKLLCNPELEEPVLKEDEVRLLVGNTSDKEKAEILEQLENGDIKLIIGTHALLEDPVKFKDLQIAIIDEQHRFGVKQRAVLRSKGENLHLLVMTATPIPRSLALTLYGDLDVSVMDEMPPGRQPIETKVFYPKERLRAYQFIRGQIKEGKQAFMIYPLVEQGSNEESKAAVEEHKRLQEDIFPRFKLGLLHGRMKASEKEEIMTKFRNKDFDILVSTSVIEVGVDVPNATVMLIEGANRFGLAQLHQFRGRVGRGDSQSYCILIPEKEEAIENERLLAMTETNDGFVLAEKDLEQRGPGDFLGTRQSGYSELRLANLTDVRLIEKARDQAQILFNTDPELELPENEKLGEAFAEFWAKQSSEVS